MKRKDPLLNPAKPAGDKANRRAAILDKARNRGKPAEEEAEPPEAGAEPSEAGAEPPPPEVPDPEKPKRGRPKKGVDPWAEARERASALTVPPDIRAMWEPMADMLTVASEAGVNVITPDMPFRESEGDMIHESWILYFAYNPPEDIETWVEYNLILAYAIVCVPRGISKGWKFYQKYKADKTKAEEEGTDGKANEKPAT